MATKRTSKRVKRSVKRPANQTLFRESKAAKGANLAPRSSAKKSTALARRGGSSRELATEKRAPWTNALGKVRVKTASKPGDKTYANKVQFVCQKDGKTTIVYHKARAKSLHDKGWDVMMQPRERPETNPSSKLYQAGARSTIPQYTATMDGESRTVYSTGKAKKLQKKGYAISPYSRSRK